jgi:RNA polymerase sigma-70 factor (ECF subfamily)
MHTDDGLSTFLCVRPRLLGIAHRMLGGAADAEDVIQDVWIRWQTTDRSSVRNATAFLMTTTTRLAINVMQSARARREVSVGAWLPEPIDVSAQPGSDVEQREALESGLLVLLAHLSRTERSAYILREAFDCPYRDIADALQLGEANARQVVTRARRHVVDGTRMQVGNQSGRATGKDNHNESGHHRRHRTHRLEAGAQAA